MNLTQQELETIEKLAGLFYTPKQIAIILEIDPDFFLGSTGISNFVLKHIRLAISQIISVRFPDIQIMNSHIFRQR